MKKKLKNSDVLYSFNLRSEIICVDEEDNLHIAGFYENFDNEEEFGGACIVIPRTEYVFLFNKYCDLNKKVHLKSGICFIDSFIWCKSYNFIEENLLDKSENKIPMIFAQECEIELDDSYEENNKLSEDKIVVENLKILSLNDEIKKLSNEATIPDIHFRIENEVLTLDEKNNIHIRGDYEGENCVIVLSKKEFIKLQNQYFKCKQGYYKRGMKYAGVNLINVLKFEEAGKVNLIHPVYQMDEDYENIYEEVKVIKVLETFMNTEHG